jgi:hypothetical protein
MTVVLYIHWVLHTFGPHQDQDLVGCWVAVLLNYEIVDRCIELELAIARRFCTFVFCALTET